MLHVKMKTFVNWKRLKLGFLERTFITFQTDFFCQLQDVFTQLVGTAVGTIPSFVVLD